MVVESYYVMVIHDDWMGPPMTSWLETSISFHIIPTWMVFVREILLGMDVFWVPPYHSISFHIIFPISFYYSVASFPYGLVHSPWPRSEFFIRISEIFFPAKIRHFLRRSLRRPHHKAVLPGGQDFEDNARDVLEFCWNIFVCQMTIELNVWWWNFVDITVAVTVWPTWPLLETHFSGKQPSVVRTS